MRGRLDVWRPASHCRPRHSQFGILFGVGRGVDPISQRMGARVPTVRIAPHLLQLVATYSAAGG
jgi:hypothetical protein